MVQPGGDHAHAERSLQWHQRKRSHHLQKQSVQVRRETQTTSAAELFLGTADLISVVKTSTSTGGKKKTPLQGESKRLGRKGEDMEQKGDMLPPCKEEHV